MKNLFILSMVSSIIFLSACQKDAGTVTNNPAPSNPNTCVESFGGRSGDTIPGQYIVAYRTNEGARTMSRENLLDRSEVTLTRAGIPGERIRKIFIGEPSGFVARLSAEEAATLRGNGEVAIVEPDRIIALASCFTVAEPRTVTWNVQRTGFGNGSGKTAWVIDTGIDFTHPDLNVDVSRSKSFIEGVPLRMTRMVMVRMWRVLSVQKIIPSVRWEWHREHRLWR